MKKMMSQNKRIIDIVLFLFACVWTVIFLLLLKDSNSCQKRHENDTNFININNNMKIFMAPNNSTAFSSMPTVPHEDSEDSDVSDSGYWVGLGAADHHVSDSNLSTALVKVFKEKNASTILELGAGMGSYSERFMLEGFRVSCYDGNPNTQELTKGRCAVLDLSKPVALGKSDWVLSLEVGEHIPRQFEETFINNLDSGNKHGMIVSWAVEGQGGRSHVNERNNSYIKQVVEMKGYSQDLETEKFLRDSSEVYWFQDTIMVFTRKQS